MMDTVTRSNYIDTWTSHVLTRAFAVVLVYMASHIKSRAYKVIKSDNKYLAFLKRIKLVCLVYNNEEIPP